MLMEAQGKIDEVAIKAATVSHQMKTASNDDSDEVEILQTPDAGSSSIKRRGAQKIRRIQIEEEEQTMDIEDGEQIMVIDSESEVQPQVPSGVELSDTEIQSMKAKDTYRKTNAFRVSDSSEAVPDDVSGYGGFVEDNDDDQVETSVGVRDGVAAIHTAQASKVKGFKLVLILHLKLIISTPCTSHLLSSNVPRNLWASSSTEIENTLCKNGAPQVTMAHLPPDVNHLIYSRFFIPTFLHIVLEHDTPFVLSGTKLMDKLAKAFKGCFPGLDYEMTTKAIIFLVQHYYELRRKYVIACQNFLTDSFNSTPTLQTPESRANYVATQGVGSTGDFLYTQTKPYRQGAFCSDVRLSAFSLHLTAITGTIYTSFRKPIGALALVQVQ
ncbi:hypothetical protein QCA50_012546 [Cerrena zonata]|uniref:Uncharacterized protein n=1 Tax=Cerrena zonata TaxID=2478898 RepID=A0AAW0G3U3_9APHY